MGIAASSNTELRSFCFAKWENRENPAVNPREDSGKRGTGDGHEEDLEGTGMGRYCSGHALLYLSFSDQFHDFPDPVHVLAQKVSVRISSRSRNYTFQLGIGSGTDGEERPEGCPAGAAAGSNRGSGCCPLYADHKEV